MQGVVDIKDNSLIVRFKFMARPKNPTMVQRMAIRRMYDQFPALGIQFATGNNYLFRYRRRHPCRRRPRSRRASPPRRRPGPPNEHPRE